MAKQDLEHINLMVNRLSLLKTSDSITKSGLSDLYKLFEFFYETTSEQSELVFSTLFSRIAFVSNYYNFSKELNWKNHQFRLESQMQNLSDTQLSALYNFGVNLLAENLNIVFNLNLKFEEAKLKSLSTKESDLRYFKIIRGLVLKFDLPNHRFLFKDYQNDFEEKWVDCHQMSFVDESFLRDLALDFPTPFHVNLLDVSYANDVLAPKSFVVEPDFLVNITAVAEGFKPNGKLTILSYLTKKLIPTETSIPLLKGNIVNFILDELIHDPDKPYETLLPTIFKLFPLVFSRMDNEALKKLLTELKDHYSNLRKVILEEWKSLNINKEKIYLEPSFYSSDYGFQGRLDVFHVNDKQLQIDIIELKSGKIYRPNAYQICHNHYVQTLLYGLLTEKIIQRSKKPSLFILYSSLSKDALRFAPTVKSKQYEAIQERNRIILLEKQMSQYDSAQYDQIINRLNPELIGLNNNFIKRDAKLFWGKYQELDKLERSYYKNFLKFISVEYQLSKTGEHGQERTNGLASIWLDKVEEKADNFSIISYLKIRENNCDQEWPTLLLEYSDRSNKLSKFRKGDIAVIYPFYGNQAAILDNQIFKCNVIEVNDDSILLKLRYQQKNIDYFNQFEFWNVEYDVLDSGFNASFKGLFRFISAKKYQRDLLLARRAPKRNKGNHKSLAEDLSSEQQVLLNNILNAEDYFLLWGPPGTGKTSFMLKYLVKHLHYQTDEKILLLSFTNRSVDEICKAVNTISEDFKDFIRLGSRLSVDQEFFDQLLGQKIKKLKTRNELREIISNNRIFIGTVASAMNNDELFKLVNFDTIIIDEASQILEPSLIGLLPKAKRFIMIGDHKQLPAVVVQKEKSSQINVELLQKETGLSNMRISLFERLYLQCVKNNWTWAYGVLTKQGRMHEELMKFSSHEFYEDKLQILEKIERLTLPFGVSQRKASEYGFLSDQRLIFINTPIDKSLYRKINKYESKLVVEVIKALLSLYEHNNLTQDENSIGVITPFRAQITQIIKDLNTAGVIRKHISVDTVERYQGSARERIIISLTSNDKSMLEAMSNISQEGIDRKLNVALTRAKEQIIILGNKSILETRAVYKHLIESSFQLDYKDFFVEQDS